VASSYKPVGKGATHIETEYTSISKDVIHCLGRFLVRCSSTMARCGENSRKEFSIATVLEGNTTTFLKIEKGSKTK